MISQAGAASFYELMRRNFNTNWEL